MKHPWKSLQKNIQGSEYASAIYTTKIIKCLPIRSAGYYLFI